MDFSFITKGFTWLLEKLNDLVTFLGDLVKAVFVAIWRVFLDALCFLIDILGKVLDGAASSLPDGVAQDWGRYWNEVPPEVVEVATAVGIVPALGIIAVAISIRLILQLIPFVRLGS